MKWFPDGQINITEQCLDENLIHRPNQIAYYIESPITGTVFIFIILVLNDHVR